MCIRDRVTKEGDDLKLVATDIVLGDDIELKPDLVVLSTGICLLYTSPSPRDS